MSSPEAPRTPEDLFGTPTGKHTHPATHPVWLEFTDGDCVVCASQVAPGSNR